MIDKKSDKLKALPDKPGVYFFLKGKEILYIGKATSLKDRVKSYFTKDLLETRGPLLIKMMEEIDDVRFEETDSVLEALILESALIKKHQPKFNTKEKDNKSYYYVIFTQEDFPKILLVRGKELLSNFEPEDIKETFGPFPKSTELKEALKIIRKIFPFRDKCELGKNKPCFNYQLGLCPGVCFGNISKQDYGKLIRQIKLFFEGKKGVLLQTLNKEMERLAKGQEFEEAKVIRDRIFALQHINDIALIKNNQSANVSLKVEGYDIAHTSGKNTVGVMTVIIGGFPEKNAYRKFIIRGVGKDKANDTGSLYELLDRRFGHPEWSLPGLLVVDGGKAQFNTAKKVLEKHSLNIPLVAVVKDDKHKPKEILGDKKIIHEYEDEILLTNMEAHRFAINFHRAKRGKLK